MIDLTTAVRIVSVFPVRQPIYVDLFGEDERSGGVGGWSELVRPRRTAAVEWNATPVLQIVLPLLIDGLGRGPGGAHKSVEPVIRALRALGRTDATLGHPPVVQLAGPIDATESQRWVLNDLTFSEPIRDNMQRRVQTLAAATFVEYREGRTVRGPAARHRGDRS